MFDQRQGRAIELDNPTTSNDRVISLVRSLFKGNQRAAAREFGLSQGVISKIVRGEQVAGQRVLAAIASHPRINPSWIYKGEGEPLLPEVGEPTRPAISDPSQGDVGPTLPVARQYLPGPPEEFPLLLTRLRLPVASPDFSRTRYWWAMPESAPILRVKGEKIVAGDHLLMETNRRLWIDHPPVLNGRLMVVRLGGEHGPDLVLARGGVRDEGGYLPLDDFGITKRIVKLAPKTPAQGWSSAYTGRQGRAIELEDDPSTSSAPQAADQRTPHSPPVEPTSGPGPASGAGEFRSPKPSRGKADLVVQLDDIASVCIMLIRS